MKLKVEDLIKSGEIAKEAHRRALELIRPGVTEQEIEAVIKEVIESAGAKPAFLGYKGYPAASCICVNDRIVHGIPSDYILEEGDIVTIDLGVSYNGAIVDTARTHPVGRVSPTLRNLLDVTHQALLDGVSKSRAGNTVGDIGSAVEKTVKAGGIHIIKDLTGHGVGKTLQEPPSIPNFGTPGKGAAIKEGMVLAIEPITSTKPTQIGLMEDGWTIIAVNGSETAQFEDTVLVTDSEPLVLT